MGGPLDWWADLGLLPDWLPPGRPPARRSIWDRYWRFIRRIYWEAAAFLLFLVRNVSIAWLTWAFGVLLVIVVVSQESVVFGLVLGIMAALMSGGTSPWRDAMRNGAVVFAGTQLLGVLLGWIAWPLRLLVLPAAFATLARRGSPDGRPLYWLIASWVRIRLQTTRYWPGPADRNGTGWAPDVWIAPDGRSGVLHYGVVHGPARLVFARPVVIVAGRGRLIIRRSAGHRLRPGEQIAEVIVLAPGQIAEVRE